MADATRIALQRAINAHPDERTPQLVYADYLEDQGEHRKAEYWRGRVGRGGLGGRVGLGGLVGDGFGGLVGVGRGGRGGLGGLGGGGLGGVGGLVGGGFGGLGGVGLGGLGGLLTQRQIMLIEGENALVFMPHGYGFAVFVGTVAQERPYGWILDPACEVTQANKNDSGDPCWAALAGGKKKSVRANAVYGELIVGGARVPQGCMSLPWQGELPEVLT